MSITSLIRHYKDWFVCGPLMVAYIVIVWLVAQIIWDLSHRWCETFW